MRRFTLRDDAVNGAIFDGGLSERSDERYELAVTKKPVSNTHTTAIVAMTARVPSPAASLPLTRRCVRFSVSAAMGLARPWN